MQTLGLKIRPDQTLFMIYFRLFVITKTNRYMLPFLINYQMCPLLSILNKNMSMLPPVSAYSTILKFSFSQNSRTLILLYSHYSGRPNPYVCVNQPGNSRAQCTKMCLKKNLVRSYSMFFLIFI